MQGTSLNRQGQRIRQFYLACLGLIIFFSSGLNQKVDLQQSSFVSGSGPVSSTLRMIGSLSLPFLRLLLKYLPSISLSCYKPSCLSTYLNWTDLRFFAFLADMVAFHNEHTFHTRIHIAKLFYMDPSNIFRNNC